MQIFHIAFYLTNLFFFLDIPETVSDDRHFIIYVFNRINFDKSHFPFD